MLGLKSFFRVWVLLGALTFIVQAASLAHAASNGDAPHEHDGVTCELGLLVVQDAVIEPPIAVPTRLHLLPVRKIFLVRRTIAWTWPPGRAPPPRSPPTLNQ